MTPQRQFAVEIVQKLRDAGYQSLWAGGCVRDGLLDRPPKDYDVATNAEPEQIREVFGHCRTLSIGAAFGVITVLGGKQRGQIEVATFRRDADYSDGRHPDSVTFSTAEEDAQRRDFTINGLFYDPLADEVIDYVGGRADLDAGVVRAIGDPAERIAEDKLRMLRAVRFAATFDFELEAGTLAALVEHAQEIELVSAERIAAELRRMLAHANRTRAVELLAASGLLREILPESDEMASSDGDAWRETLAILRELADEAPFAVALAVLLRRVGGSELATTVVSRWKLTNDEAKILGWLLQQENLIGQAADVPWPQLQRVLVADHATALLDYCQAVASVCDGDSSHVQFCRDKLALPPEQLNPTPLIDGNDLKRAGISPGPRFKELLTAARDAQLEHTINSKDQALALVREMLAAGP